MGGCSDTRHESPEGRGHLWPSPSAPPLVVLHPLVVRTPVLEVLPRSLRVGRAGAVGVGQEALDRSEQRADGVDPKRGDMTPHNHLEGEKGSPGLYQTKLCNVKL